MKNKSWNETWTNSKEFEVSDQKVVTREHHKRISHVRQDIIKEQHMMERRSPNESFTNTNDVFKIDDQKVEKNFKKTSTNKSRFFKKVKHLKYQRLMKNKSWNETWTINEGFQISDEKVVTREHHKRISRVRQDIIKEQHMMERRSPNESFTNTNDGCKIYDQKVE